LIKRIFGILDIVINIVILTREFQSD